MKDLLTLKELAEQLRVTEKTIYRLLAQGKIPATKVGHQWRFDKASVARWLKTGSNEERAKILVIDDEEGVRALFEEALDGYDVLTTGNSYEAIALLKLKAFDLAFVDLKIPEMDGAELFLKIRTIQPRLPVVIITGYPDSEMMARALKHGPLGVMNKPFVDSDIVNAIKIFLSSNVQSNEAIPDKHKNFTGQA